MMKTVTYRISNDELINVLADYIGEDNKNLTNVRFEFMAEETVFHSCNPHKPSVIATDNKSSFNLIVDVAKEI